MPYDNVNTANIRDIIKNYTEHIDECGFEVFLVTKNQPQLHRISLDDQRDDNVDHPSFKKRIKLMMLGLLAEKYLSDDAEFAMANTVADNQHKFFLIPQANEVFFPFAFLTSEPVWFTEDNLDDATGVLFAVRKGEDTIWLYQHKWASQITKMKSTSPIARILHIENQFLFCEQRENMMTLAKKIDILIIGNTIVTENIKLMERSFNFRDFILSTAHETVQKIVDNGIIASGDKLIDYINRGKPQYAKKMMRISDSKVLLIAPDELIRIIDRVDRWKNAFVYNNEKTKIELSTYAHVELLIDLLDERYTKSEITNAEYDTDVKQIAGPVNYEQLNNE